MYAVIERRNNPTCNVYIRCIGETISEVMEWCESLGLEAQVHPETQQLVYATPSDCNYATGATKVHHRWYEITNKLPETRGTFAISKAAINYLFHRSKAAKV